MVKIKYLVFYELHKMQKYLTSFFFFISFEYKHYKDIV